MDTIKEALTFDDVLLLPRYSSVLPSKTNINLSFTKKINLKVPFLSSAMDTVTESKMAIAIGKEGGIGIIHRNLDIKNQSKEVKKVASKKLLVGAAIGTNKEDIERAKSLISNGADLIVIDTAHGHSEKVLKTLSKIKKIVKDVPICVGNIATGEAAKRLYNSGADIIKVGIGPGSICTTRMVAGIGVPQISAILEVLDLTVLLVSFLQSEFVHCTPCVGKGCFRRGWRSVKRKFVLETPTETQCQPTVSEDVLLVEFRTGVTQTGFGFCLKLHKLTDNVCC